MAQTDLHESLRSIVAEQLQEALAPHQELLEQIASFLGLGGATGVRTTRVARSVPSARTARATSVRGVRGTKGRGRGRASTTTAAASSFKEGQDVRYRQGRGEFEATVISIDDAGVTVERKTDGKQVTRPADKLYAA